MTTPVAHDYPDWGRQLSATDIIVMNRTALVLNSALVENVKPVPQLPYVFVNAIANAQRMEVALSWFADAAGTISLGDDSAQCGAGSDVRQTFPVRGPFLQVTVSLSAYPDTVTVRIHMAATPAIQYGGPNASNALIDVLNGGPLGGGANVTIPAVTTRGGEAYFEADVLNATTFTIYLRALDFAGGVQNLASFYPAKRATRVNLHLPPLRIEVQVFNQDAGAHDYRVLLSHKMFEY